MSALSAPRQAPATGASIAIQAATARSVDFMEAMIAAGVMLAYADGEMARAERRRLVLMARENPMLASYPRQRIIDELAAHEANFHLDPELAQVLAREKLALLSRDVRGRDIVGACRQVVAADGIAHPAEFRVLAEISTILGLDEAIDAGASGSARRTPRGPGQRS